MAGLLAFLGDRHGLDLAPGATATFVSRGSNRRPAGEEVTTPTVSGHRDMSATACPGDAADALLADGTLARLATDARRPPPTTTSSTRTTTATTSTSTTTPTSTTPTSGAGEGAAPPAVTADGGGGADLPVVSWAAAAVVAGTAAAVTLRRRRSPGS